MRSKKTLTQSKIYSICTALISELPDLLTKLEIDYIEYPNRYSFSCPIHGGDNNEGCSIFTDGHSSKGNWQCWTHHCEEDYTNNIFGFVRGILSARSNRKVSLIETENFCTSILNGDIKDIDQEKTVIDVFSVFAKKPQSIGTEIPRDKIRSRLQIPSQYFIKRGFSSDVLDKFDIGLCLEKNKPMYNRAVAPVYDQNDRYIGCVGRSTDESIKPKWLHSKGFKKCVLYGLNLAKNSILESRSVVLVEGQGDVWKMHEAGLTQTVGIFGSSINDDQLLLLEESGALNIVILTDYDEAGEKAADQIVKKCGRRFNYYRPIISTKDVGEMSVDEIKQDLYPQLKKFGILVN